MESAHVGSVRDREGTAPDEQFRVAIHQADSMIDASDPKMSLRRNVSRMFDAIQTASGEAINLVVFGEGFLNGYQSGDMLPELALDVADPSDLLEEVMASVNEFGLSIIFGATTSKGSYPGSLFNSAVVLRPDKEMLIVDKTHLSEFRYKGEPVVSEKLDWATGSELSPVFDIDGFKVGVEICHDIVFPEVARSLCMKGAELIVNVSAAVSGFDWFWNSIPATRAFENGVWYVHATVVSAGGQPELLEHSRVVDPFGSVVAEAPNGQDCVLTHSLNTTSVAKARAALKPFTERRPEIYDPRLAGR
jgi:predicted amidohydrolase